MLRRVASLLMSVPVASAGLAASPFDGRWAVEVRPEHGGCSGFYVMPVDVVDSEIRYAGRGDVAVEGRIDLKGGVTARFFNGSGLVNASGTIRGGRFGNGSWISPSEDCGGTWIARKR